MEIIIADNDVLVEIFDGLYHARPEDFNRLMNLLQTRFSRIWVPRTVAREFRITPKRGRLFSRHMRRFPGFFEICPVPVSNHEMALLMSNRSGVHEGEADGINQAKKAETLRRYPQVFVFFSRDKKALRQASDFGLSILGFDEFKIEAREAGIVV